MILTIISLLIFVVYLFFAIKRYGIPTSLSETYYLLGGEPFNRLKASIFTFALWAMAIILLPVMIDVTPDQWRFLAFLALAGICFVGAAPEFMDEFEGKVHTISAITAACFGLLWALAVCKQTGLISLGVSAFAVLVAALMTDTFKSSRTFWLEMIAFGTVYLSTMLMLL